MKNIPIIIVCLLFAFTVAQAQDKVEVVHEVGLNMTPFVAQLIPFNSTTNQTGPYDFSYKRYKGDRAFRLGLGMHVRPDFFFGEERLNSFNLRLGWEKRRTIHNNWKFTRAFDAFFYGGNLNLPTDRSDDDGGLGAAMAFGVEYHFNDRMYASTEAAMLVGLSASSGIILEFIPPIGAFLHMRF